MVRKPAGESLVRVLRLPDCPELLKEGQDFFSVENGQPRLIVVIWGSRGAGAQLFFPNPNGGIAGKAKLVRPLDGAVGGNGRAGNKVELG